MPSDHSWDTSLCHFFWAETGVRSSFHTVIEVISRPEMVTSKLFAELERTFSFPVFEVSVSQIGWLFVL